MAGDEGAGVAVTNIGVDVRRLSKTFVKKHQSREILRDISFVCSQGDFVTIVGASGIGKTTLMRCLAGLEEPSGGEIFVEGARVCGPGLNRAMVFQEARLFPWLTVESNVAFGLQGRMPRAEMRALVAEQLAFIGLTDYAKSYPRHLSGGMAQRVALARALAFQAPVLLLDEPFSSLDVRTRGQLQEDVLKLWQKKNKTIIMVTHDIEEALIFSKRILTLGERPGRVLHELTVDLPYPRDPDTPEFIALRKQVSAGLHVFEAAAGILSVDGRKI